MPGQFGWEPERLSISRYQMTSAFAQLNTKVILPHANSARKSVPSRSFKVLQSNNPYYSRRHMINLQAHLYKTDSLESWRQHHPHQVEISINDNVHMLKRYTPRKMGIPVHLLSFAQRSDKEGSAPAVCFLLFQVGPYWEILRVILRYSEKLPDCTLSSISLHFRFKIWF